MKYILTLLSTLIFLLTNSIISTAQTNSDKPFIAVSSASGEETIRELEMIAVDSESSGERLFVIARLGKGEKAINKIAKYTRINLARLAYTKSFLLRMRQFPFQSPVFAEGERTESEGRIEFYLGSRLRLVILAKRNQMPNLTCCPEYIPPAKRRGNRSKIK